MNTNPPGYMTAKEAARRLGVSIEMVAGLVRAGHLNGLQTHGKTGHPVTLVRRDSFEALERIFIAQDRA